MGTKNNILLTSILVASCATLEPESTMFKYSYNNIPSVIMCNRASEYYSEPHNILHIISKGVKAIDYDRDMYLDKVLSGDLSLETAQEFYDAGLNIAKERGLVKHEQNSKSFDFNSGNYKYRVTTVFTPDGIINNFSAISEYNTCLAQDYEADGTLDKRVSNHNISNIQEMYQNTLKEGLQTKNIEEIDGKFLVKTKK